MLAEETVKTIRKLLETTTLSQRAVARKLGVHRETVHRIAAGKRFDVDAYRRARAAEAPRALPQPIRCAGCGALIAEAPCVLCKLRRAERHRFRQAARRKLACDDQLPLGVELKAVHRRRYLAVRDAKVRRGELPATLFERCYSSPCSGDDAMPVIANVKYIRWFLAHLDDLAPLLDLPARLRKAPDLTARWELLKSTGDLLVRLIQEFPVQEYAAPFSALELKSEVEGRGISWDALLELLPLLIRLITLLEGDES